MTFKELFPEFISGTPIKRKSWGGYWKYNTTVKNIEMYNQDKTVLLFTNTQDVLFTLSHITADDWERATSGNCTVEIV